MDELLRIGLSNAVVAAVLALAALIVSRVCRRPALTHALWLLVLIKLITPPLRSIPIDWPPLSETGSGEITAALPPTESLPFQEETVDAADFRGQAVPDPEADFDVAALPKGEPVADDLRESLPEHDSNQPVSPASNVWSAISSWRDLPWIMLFAFCWLSGSAIWLSLAAWRTWKFHLLLSHARPAPSSLRADARRLARRLGLTRCPGVWFVPGRVSPMLWALNGKPRLLIPAALWPTLNEEQRATLLLHEMAHLRRGDHWVRALEIVTTCLYWWHPVVWLARRELREAEEQCCDAWVVWALPRSARAYALALVETLDFLSEARPALPAVASGAGHVHDLRRRLTMIMRGSTPRRLNWGGFLAVLGVGAILLPMVPTWAQDSPPRGQGGERRPEAGQREDVERARADLAKMEAEMKRMHDQMASAERRLQEARARIAEMEGRRGAAAGGGGERRTMVIVIEDEQGRQVRRLEVKPGDGDVIRIPAGTVQRGEEERSTGPRRNDDGSRQPGRGNPDRRPGAGPNVPHDGPTPGGSGPRPGNPGAQGAAGPPTPGGLPPGVPGMPQPSGAAHGPDQERRLQDLERKLDTILRDLQKMRDEMRGPRDRGPGSPRSDAGPQPRVEERDVIRRAPAQPRENIEKKIERRSPRPGSTPPAGGAEPPSEDEIAPVPPPPTPGALPPNPDEVAPLPPAPATPALPPADRAPVPPTAPERPR